MTLFIPDISHHQGDISIQALKNAGCPAVIARVGQGAGRRSNGQTYGTTQDRKWTRNLSEARRLGLPIVPYWYIGNLISADENARLAASWVGDTSLPWMLDHEDASGSIGFYHEVRQAFARRGLRVVLGYIPRWYWDGAGARGALTPGPPLMSSRYSTANGTPAQIYAAAGADNGAGWAGYGGAGVALWQFTNKASLAGQAIDCSAYRGTPTQLAALLGGATTEEDDMATIDEIMDYPVRREGNYGGGGTGATMTLRLLLAYWPHFTEGGIADTVKNKVEPGELERMQKMLDAIGSAGIDPVAVVAEMAASATFMDGLATRMALLLADEQDRRARDGDPTTGPTS